LRKIIRESIESNVKLKKWFIYLIFKKLKNKWKII
jgi:hypothetical protein